MNYYKYAIIGNNWGSKIHKILKDYGKSSKIFNLNYRNLNFKEYLKELKKFINQNEINIIWLAIPPVNQYEICKSILNSNCNIIIEKPLLISENEKNYLNYLIKKTDKQISVHYEYIFLKELLNFNYNLKFDSIDFIFNHSKNQKSLKPKLDLGIHMVAIKKIYFNFIKKYTVEASFKSINQRIINFKNKNQIVYSIDFTNSNQKIIQLFINYFENKVLMNKENKLSINFSMNVINELSKKYD